MTRVPIREDMGSLRARHKPTILISRLLVVMCTLALFIQGCSMFQSKKISAADLNSAHNFVPRVAARENARPVPIEVARDFSDAMQEPVAYPNVGNNPYHDELDRKLASADDDDSTDADDADETSNDHKSLDKLSKIKGGQRGHHPAEKYVVNNGDTLMKISFAKYGNVYRWREILNQNKPKIPNFNHLVVGTVLHIAGYDYVVVERNGKPYLIRRDDSLVKISKSLYGKTKFWKNLWHNNPQLIINPNKIYTGFTMYYEPKVQ